MSVTFGDNISYKGKQPLDSRAIFKTIAEMSAYSDNYLPSLAICQNEEDGKLYTYNASNEVDTTTGKWRVFEGGDSEVLTAITKAEYDALTEEEKKDKYYFITDATSSEDEIVGLISKNANNKLTTGTDGGLFVPNMATAISTNTGNILTKGSDDGLYVPATTVVSTYSSTGTDAVNGKAVAAAISDKANSNDLGTQVTYRLAGTTLYITTK